MRWMFVYHDLYLTRLTELFAWRNGHSSVTRVVGAEEVDDGVRAARLDDTGVV